MTASRRDALRHVGGAAVAAAAAPLLLGGVRDALAAAGGDEEVILGALRLEQAAVVAYRTAADSGALDPRTARIARTFAAQEQAHADALAADLRQLGGVVPSPPAPAMVRAGGKAVTDLHTQPALLAFAAELETMAIAGYYEAQQRLRRAEYLQTTASIMANEGQHLAVLREALKRPPVPNAFETGNA